MPPKRRNTPQSFAPAPTNAAYVDLLRFEERLKQVAEGLQRTRRRYEAFLYGLITLILLLAYTVFLNPSPYLYINYFYIGSLLICIVTLILFFTTGLYNDKIAYAHRYIPSANRSLRPLNIYFNASVQERSRSFLSFLLYPFPSFYAPAPPMGPTSPTTPPRSSSPTPRSPAKAVPLAPIPPSANPRGELIFNSKVTPAFRDGYERFRHNWAQRNDPWQRFALPSS
ncbi:hypothetical protein BT69DRAFT_1342230 [Atractiella rhizophila]|nr:hypothetical protein BT69DRAFT_1342230 [Atractiella rhizophila]